MQLDHRKIPIPKNNYDWSGMFQTIAAKVAKSASEEQMYRILKDFKDEFNTEYGKLSRAKRLTDGFRDWEDNA